MSKEKPINDAMEHMKNIEGYPTGAELKNIRKLPKGFRFFGYFILVFFTISSIAVTILDWFM